MNAGCHTGSHYFYIITALLVQNQSSITQALSNLYDDTIELCESCRGEIHIRMRACLGNGIFPMRIEAGRDQDQLWLETIGSRSHYLEENRLVDLVAGHRRYRHINGCPQSCSLAPPFGA